MANSRIEVLLSTFGNRISRIPFNPDNFPDIHFLIMHQTEPGPVTPPPFASKKNVTIHQLIGQRGLSLSRNTAIMKSTADICLLADDDVKFKPDLVAKLTKAFFENPTADIIAFCAETPDGTPLKKYHDRKLFLNRFQLGHISSIEIAFRRDRIMSVGLKFDPLFGLGSHYETGEEFIFLTDALKSGLTILHIPECIVQHPQESSGRVRDRKTIFARGAMMARVFGWNSLLFDLLFALKKRNEYASSFSLFRHAFLLWQGSWDYLTKNSLLQT